MYFFNIFYKLFDYLWIIPHKLFKIRSNTTHNRQLKHAISDRSFQKPNEKARRDGLQELALPVLP